MGKFPVFVCKTAQGFQEILRPFTCVATICHGHSIIMDGRYEDIAGSLRG